MSERARVAVIFGVIGAVALGGGYYYFGVYGPKQVKRAAQAEVTAWEQRWTAARDCLLGKAPGSPRTSEALAIHELSPDPWNKSTCTPLLAHLNRGDAPDTGLTEVEAAWRELDHAASKAAQAFAEHAVQRSVGGLPVAPQAAKDPLPGALDALDAARLVLRTSVGLADDTAAHIPPLAVAEVAPLAIGSDAVWSLDGNPQLSAHGLHAFGKTASGADVQLDLPIGGKPRIARIPPNALRAEPDGSWGAAATADGTLAIGAIDANGGMTSPIANSAKNVASVVAAIGTLADGTVLYSAGGAFAVAHVKNGAVTLDAPIPVASGDTAIDLDGRALAWWVAAGDAPKSYARTFGFGAPQPLSIADTSGGTGCLDGDRAWLASVGGVTSVAAAAAQVPDLTEASLLGCSPDGALVTMFEDGKPSFLLCGDTCSRLKQDLPVPTQAHGVAKGQLVAAKLSGTLLAVWRGPTAAATYYTVPGEDGAAVQRIYVDGKSLVLVVEGNGVALVRVPL